MKKILLILTTLTTILIGCSKNEGILQDDIPNKHIQDSITYAQHIQDSIINTKSGTVWSKRTKFTGVTTLYYVTYRNCATNNFYEFNIGNGSGLNDLTEYYRPYGYKRLFWFTW